METPYAPSDSPTHVPGRLTVRVNKDISFEQAKERLHTAGMLVYSDPYWHELSRVLYVQTPSDDLEKWMSLLYEQDIVRSVEKIRFCSAMQTNTPHEGT